MLKLDLGDAAIWMRTAEDLYLQSAQRAQAEAGFPQTNQLNVACVCAGYAFELLFKVLVRAGGGKPAAKHAPSEAYEMMKELPDKGVESSVDQILGQHGWEDPEVFLGFLDDLCKVERKYWGLPPSGHGSRSSTFHIGGSKAFDALRRSHQALSGLALRKIESNCGFEEIWPGLRQHRIEKPPRSYFELTQHVKATRED